MPTSSADPEFARSRGRHNADVGIIPELSRTGSTLRKAMRVAVLGPCPE